MVFFPLWQSRIEQRLSKERVRISKHSWHMRRGWMTLMTNTNIDIKIGVNCLICFFFSFVCDVWICRQMDDSYLPLWLAISALRNQSEVIASIVRERHCQFKFEQLQQQQTIKIYKFIFRIAHTQHRQKWAINLNYCNDLVFRSEK